MVNIQEFISFVLIHCFLRQKNNEDIQFDTNFIVSQNENKFALSFNKVQVKDSGTYSAIAQNKVGKIITKCDLLVVHEPRIKSALKDTTVIVKRNIVLEAEINSPTPCTVQWFKDNIPLSGILGAIDGRITVQERKGGVYQISIKNVKEEDAGLYRCAIKNQISEVETAANLDVHTPPVFVQKLDKIDAVENCEAEICVEVSGNPKPAITWFKNSDEIDLKKNNKYEDKIKDNFYSLCIKSIAANDAGTYQCVITNSVGKSSSLGKLTIYPLTAPKFIKSLDALKWFPENENIKLSVEVSGIPIPKLIWFKDSKLIIDDNKNYEFKKDISKGEYSILSKFCGKHFSGNYEVKATNPGGEVVSVCEIKCEGYRPSFEDRPEKIVCLDGETATLGCKINGLPVPTVKWLLKGKEIADKDSKKYKSYFDQELKAHFLEIFACGNNDKATYQVVATNIHGSETAAVSLIISDRPEEASDYKSALKNVELDALYKKIDDPDWGKLKNRGAKENSPDDESNKIKLKHVEFDKNEDKKDEKLSEMKLKESDKTEIGQRDKTQFSEYQKTTFNDDANNLVASENRDDRNRISSSANQREKDISSEPDRKISIETDAVVKSQKENVDNGAKIIKRLPEKIGGKLKENLTLEVKVIGEPKPTINWYFEDKEIKQNKDFTIEENDEEQKLVISKFDKEFCGHYIVKAKNRSGNDMSDCETLLLQKPELIENLKDLSIIENDTAQFKIKWTSFPDASINWFVDNNRINSSLPDCSALYQLMTNEQEGISSIKIMNCKVTESNVKTIVAVIKNEIGETESQTATLTINSKFKNLLLKKCNIFYV